MSVPLASVDGSPYLVAVEGLDSIDFEEAAQKVKRLAAKAVNTTARRYRTESARQMREQINFPSRYLTGRDSGRLRISRTAKPELLEATITGRDRPTSLVRFIRGPKRHGRTNMTIEVGTGQARKLNSGERNRIFMMNLRGGNIGLAVRLREGERVENKRTMVQVSGNLYLLYGPSVDQVFRGVAEDVSDDAADFLEREFTRLTEALL